MKKIFIAFLAVLLIPISAHSSIISDYFHLVQNKNLSGIEQLLYNPTPERLRLYKLIFAAVDQRVNSVKIKKTQAFGDKAIVEVHVNVTIYDRFSKRSFNEDNNLVFLLQKQSNRWKIAKVMPLADFILKKKLLIIKKAMDQIDNNNEVIYNTAENGENFLNNNQNSNSYEPKNNYTYLGCFKDQGDPYGLNGRDLAAFGFGSDKMTPDLCMRECARRGYRYAGVQYSSQCFCGNSYGKYGPATNCNMNCTGDKNQICGGNWANSIYNVVGLNVPKIHYGDGVEDNIDRPGLDYKNFNLPYPDYKLCQDACDKDPECKAWTYVKPYTIQGAYAKCWLKNAVPNPVRNKCCISGVKRRTHVSHAVTESRSRSIKDNYIGCFKDQGDPYGTQGRDLDKKIVSASDMSVEKCISICRSSGYRYAGVQYGSQCFCDNDYGLFGPANNCNMKCSGNPNEICGGFWANSVYATNVYNTADGGENFIGHGDKPTRNFRDDFYRFNPINWETYEWKTLRRLNGASLVYNGILDLLCNRTDQSPFVASKPIPLKEGEVFVLRRRVKAHYANNYFEGGIWFYQTDGSDVRMPKKRAAWLSAFGTGLFQVTYYNYVYEKPGVRQYVPAKHGFVLSGANWRQLGNYGVLQPIWDQWFVEEIVYDPETATVRYRINGQEVTAKAAPLRTPFIRFIMHPYGWYTGHEIQVDWIEWSVRPKSLVGAGSGTVLIDTVDMLNGNSPHHISQGPGVGSDGHSSVRGEGTIITNVLIATRKLPTGEPDPNTVTDHLPDGNSPFYLFIYYNGAQPTDRIGVKWYWRPFGSQKEELLFDRDDGKLPDREGIFSAEISPEDGAFPHGEYHLIFTVNGKKVIEKYFTIGRR
ncbi:WSC domain-containing protein [Thermosulfurimonas dismutans]|uniref:WSC domain-containing protein n=1 Tax=Thermosulfurimonas dismutans TaxID=999894 RepID=A0A179D652_9BACT|nr:WSC domain-containing protein [Thermosulfurimonas dismutans]OAQ20922.1 hypothetical protein TDIS_1049 [Thermosulfurimonas dismutans]